MKRIFGLVLSAVITLMVALVDVQAATVIVNTEKELSQALTNGEKVILGSDITITQNIYTDKSFSLDMNGHDIIFDEKYGSSAFIMAMDLDAVVEIVDTVGGGSFRNKNDEGKGFLLLEVEDAEIIGVDISDLIIYSGKNVIANCNIDYLNCVDLYHFLEVDFLGDVNVEELVIEGGVYNFDPSEHLNTGLIALDNGDGTYTIGYECIEEQGVTQKLYFDNFIDEDGKFYFSDKNTKYESADKLMLEIYYVTGNSVSNIYLKMVPEDPEGKLWSAKIDKAYADAFCGVFPEGGLSEVFAFVIPYQNGAIVDTDGNITFTEEETELPSEQPSETQSEPESETPNEDVTEIPEELPTDVETEGSVDETKPAGDKEPNEDLPYIIGVVCFGIVVVVTIVVVLAYKKKQESSL